MSPPPGFPCPQCGFRLIATVQMLLGMEPLCCGQCGLKLSVAVEESADALKAVHELNDALEQARISASQK